MRGRGGVSLLGRAVSQIREWFLFHTLARILGILRIPCVFRVKSLFFDVSVFSLPLRSVNPPHIFVEPDPGSQNALDPMNFSFFILMEFINNYK